MGDELISLIEIELGTIKNWEEECRGVYYLSIQPNRDSNHCSEYYVVLEKSCLSRDALVLGKALDGVPCRLYAIDPPEEGAWTAVMYELCKYRLSHGLPAPDGWPLADIAVKGMELCPAYFGTFPVPPRTPWGWTLRYKALDNGIYWVETSRAKSVLAVCYPIWMSELSDGVIKAGRTLGDGRPFDDEEPLNYLFFDETFSCIAIFELLKVRPEWLRCGTIRKPELMNAIWRYAPLYRTFLLESKQASRQLL